MSELPENWDTAPLSAISSDVPQRVPDPAERFTYIDIGSINRETKTIAAPQELLGKDAPSRARKQVATGDTLVSMTRPNLNAVALVPPSLDGQIASTGFDVLRPLEGIDPRWLAYLVRTEQFVSAMSELVQGALYPAVRTKDVRAYVAPIAPSKEQTRIADQLDTFLARINAYQRRLETIPALLKRFRQAVLSSCVPSGSKVDRQRLSEIASVIDPNPKHRNPTYVGDGELFLSTANFAEPDGWDFSSARRVTIETVMEQQKRCRFDATSLVLSRKGTIGKVRMVPTDRSFALLDSLVVINAGPNVLPKYLLFVLQSSDVQEQIAELTRGVALKQVSVGAVRSLLMNVPTLAEQTSVVQRVERLLLLVDRIAIRANSIREHAGRLTPLVLSKAFRGELLPQDPSDEPASELLARIAAQRKSATPPPKTRQPRAPRAARAPKESAAMTKSRQDADVKDKPYLAGHLRRLGEPVAAQALFQVAELPVADFYKQLAWEVAQGHVKDNTTTLEPSHAAG